MSEQPAQHDTTGLGAGLGQEPRANPFARWVTILIGLLFIALAVIAGREIWAISDKGANAPQWLKPVFELFGGPGLPGWALAAGIIAIIVGIIFIIVALKPRRRTHRRVTSEVSLWTRPVDVSRMASQAARKVPGVSTAHSTVKGSTLAVSIAGDTTDSSLAQRVEETLSPLVANLENPKQVKVRVQKEEVQK
ncbi:DUF6286 domain-containing protein [Corynebacterium uropygiale]|uniref:DUF6286 domain-containing protein n=1 Tax=Corynebacterium uropygiale TaxID=1775911 RepID=A0A9X1TYI8_9CORY|nr:DUF6286 domain-containing protein [Corynebacterium uropygiale]MCF4005886.1 DUF6286 domain-containing protein [Corynebacterium uropygiale]